MAATGSEMEIVLVAQAGALIQTLNQAGAAAAEMAKNLRGTFGALPAAVKPAEQSVQSFGKAISDFKREQVGQGRMVGFYVAEFAEFTGASATAQAGVRGFGGAIAEALSGGKFWGPLAALELMKGAIGMIREESKRAAEEMKKFIGEAQKAVEAGTQAALVLSKKERGRSITLGGGDAELSGARSEAVAAVQALQGFERRLGLTGKRPTDDVSGLGLSAEQLTAWSEMTARVQKASAALREYVSIKPQNDAAAAGFLGPGNKAGVDAFLKDSANAKLATDKQTADALALVYENLANEMQRLADEEDRAVTVQAARLKEMGKELSEDDPKKYSMFGPGNNEGEKTFYETGVKEQVELAQSLQGAWQDVGAAMAGAFNMLGNAIGGAAGKFLSSIGEMISQAIKFAIAMAAASVAQTPVIGGLMAAAAAIGLATSLVATIASVPSYDVGTSYVPQTGLAMIHKGEAIITAEDNARGAGRGSNVNVTLNVTAMDGRDVYRTLTGSRSQLARVVREAVRDGVM